MVIIHAYIEPVVGQPFGDGYLRFGRTIEALGPMEDYRPVPGEPCLDAQGQWLLPGLVDIHTHLGLFGDSVGFEGEDCNELGDPITPQLRVIDAINPMDRSFQEAREAGITAVAVAPGSSNPIAGQIAAIHTGGRRIDDMILRAPLAMKFSLGENPKRDYHSRNETPVTRMGTAAMIRQALMEAKAYGERQQAAREKPNLEPPEPQMKHEALLSVLRGEIQAHFHALRLDDIFTAIRISKEFGLDYVIIHGTEAHLAADILAQEGTRIVTGPSLTDRGKPEQRNLTFAGASVLSKAGVLCSICTDHPETPLQYLSLCAALAEKNGLGHREALEAITIHPAKIAGLDGEIGSLEIGKWADMALFDGDPLVLASRCRGVWIQGRKWM